MAKQPEPLYRIGDYWIAGRNGSDKLYRYWYDEERKVTRRASLGTSDIEIAKEKLTAWFIAQNSPKNSELDDILLSEVILRYYEQHARNLQSHEASRLNLTHWLRFFGPDATLRDATDPHRIDAFVAHLSEAGRSASYINRILTDGRSAINRAWKKGEISHAPFIASVEEGEAEPKGRPMEMDELRLFYHSADTQHLRRFILWALGTAARPSAVLELHSSQIDLNKGVIDLNPRGRKQTKKIRPAVKLPRQLKPFVIDGFQIVYRDKRVASIKNAWRKHRARCHFDDRVNPYSLRHTIARHLRASGVDVWEVSAQLGHKKKDRSITEIYAPMDPTYLQQSLVAIEEFLGELMVAPSEQPLMSLPDRCQCKRLDCPQCVDFIGAGDEIRTHDPNLGKALVHEKLQ